MKRKIVIACVFLLTLSLCFNLVPAARPSKTALNVTILDPQDGITVDDGAPFIVTGEVLAKRGDAGLVETYVQYAVGEDSSDFMDVDGSRLELVSGAQPQTAELSKDGSYLVSWTLTGTPGIYEIRIYSQGSTAKSAASESRTVTIVPESPPGIELVDSDYRDSDISYGSVIGTYSDTFYSDDIYEVLSEGINKQGTKSPGDDTSELGWIFEFNGLSARQNTKLYIECHADFPSRDAYYEGFSVQVEYLGVWYDVVSVLVETADKVYSAELPDDGCQSIRVRIIDLDRTVGDRIKSLFYIDQFYLDISGSQVINPGFELLFGGNLYDFTVSAWELASDSWYYDRSFPAKYYGFGDHTGYVDVGDILVIDVDGDGKSETIVGGQYVQIFDWINGAMIPTQTIVQPGSEFKGIRSIAAADLDGDGGEHLELLVSSINFDIQSSVFKWIDGAYVPIFNISSDYRRTVGHCACAIGDVDGDSDLEFLVVEEYPTSNLNPGHLLLRLFDYNGNTWIEIADYSFELGNWNWIDNVQMLDLDNDGVDEIFVHHRNNPSMILEYTDGELVKTWETSHPVISARVGNILNNGQLQIVTAWLLGPLDSDPTPGFIVYEFVNGAFKNTFNFTAPMFQGCGPGALKIGDVDGDGQNEMVFEYYTDIDNPPQHCMFSVFRNGVLIFTGDTGYGTSGVVAIGDYDNDAG